MAETMKLNLPGEVVITASDQNSIELTNYRVRFDTEAAGSSNHISIPLDAISSCGLITRSHPLLLIVAGIAIVAGLAQSHSQGVTIVLMIVTLVLVAAYFFTRSAVITISSGGGENIVVPASGLAREQILPFLNSVLEAKLKFIERLGLPIEDVPVEVPSTQTAPERNDGPKGICPACEAVISLTSLACPKCRAIFGSGSSWQVKPPDVVR